MQVRVRLAPSPTGTLHIGTARTALFNWLFAFKNEGKFLLRIEDTDKERSKPEYIKNILDGLKWLGLDWDEEPVIQSEQVQKHKLAIKQLLDQGLAYRCYATEEELEIMREDQKSKDQAPRYDNRYRSLTFEEEEKLKSEGRTAVIRFRIEENLIVSWTDLIRGQINWSTSDLGGDMVISRRASPNKIGDPLYNLAVVIDDSSMKITHVIRGEDHIANTAKQILLYKALKLEMPTFAHTPLILNEEGKKLSKRDGVTSISDFQNMGYTSEAMSNYMTLLGWSVPEGMDERFSLKEVGEVFDFGRINKAGAKFDWSKLNWLNSQVIHQWSPEELLKNIEPIWEANDWKISSKGWGVELAKLIGASMTVLKDAKSQAKPFFETPIPDEKAKEQLSIENARTVLKFILEKLDKNPWDGKNDDFPKELIDLCVKEVGVKKGLIMKSLRASLLGEMNGPDLIASWALLACIGEDRIRLRTCL